jgi:hypothetical protein
VFDAKDVLCREKRFVPEREPNEHVCPPKVRDSGTHLREAVLISTGLVRIPASYRQVREPVGLGLLDIAGRETWPCYPHCGPIVKKKKRKRKKGRVKEKATRQAATFSHLLHMKLEVSYTHTYKDRTGQSNSVLHHWD